MSARLPIEQAASVATSCGRGRQLAILVGCWLALVAATTWLVTRDLTAPGLYHDEATYLGQAKDFLTGKPQVHMPGTMAVPFLGRPFPLFSQPYLGGLKAWMAMPGLALFGFTTAAARMTSLFWCALSVLLFMLWVRALAGLRVALVAGALIGLDPSYLFFGVYDYGPVVPSYVARMAAFGLALHWWRHRRWSSALLTGIALGLGVFHKLDFVAVLAGSAAGVALAYGDRIWLALRGTRSLAAQVVIAAGGFVLGMGPMLGRAIQQATHPIGGAAPADELARKLHTLWALYDGSYLWRLIDSGIDAHRMPWKRGAAQGPFGFVVLGALLIAPLVATRFPRWRRPLLLAITAGVVTTVVVLLMPAAHGIHHALLVAPWPHLLVAIVLVAAGSSSMARATRRVAIALILFVVLLAQVHVIRATEALIHRTGGRGLWSEALDRFAATIRTRRDLKIVSLDLGFHEQLCFLTDGPLLREAIWYPNAPDLLAGCADPDRIYLAHPSSGTYFQIAGPFLHACLARSAARLIVEPYRDREGHDVFFAIRFIPRPLPPAPAPAGAPPGPRSRS